MTIKPYTCDACSTVIVGDDIDSFVASLTDHVRTVHEWPYPDLAIRNFADATQRVDGPTERLEEIGEVTVEPGRMSVVVRDLEGDASRAGPGGMVAMTEGAATFDVALPLEAAGMAVSEVQVIVGADIGMVLERGDFGGGFWPDGYTAELRDPSTGEWQLLGDLSERSRFTIGDPAAAITPAGRIEVRVRAEGGNPNFGPNTVFVSARVTGVIGE